MNCGTFIKYCTAVALSLVTISHFSSSVVSALDTAKANNYCSMYTGSASVVPKEYGGGGFNPYYSAYEGPDCTNFVSQVLYVAGMSHSGGPGSNSKIDGSGCKTHSTSKWYFRKVVDKHSNLVSCWSSTWTVAHLQRGILPTGLNAYLKNIDCRYESGLTFNELVNLEEDKQVKPGDIIQISADGSINYGHSIYVNHVVTVGGEVIDILYSGHTNEAFYKSLADKFKDNTKAKFTVFHTSDY